MGSFDVPLSRVSRGLVVLSLVRFVHYQLCARTWIIVSIVRAMWFTVCVWGVVVGRGQFPRVSCMGNPQTRVLPNWNSSAARGLLQRSVPVVSWEVSGFSTHTGSTRSTHLAACLFPFFCAYELFSCTVLLTFAIRYRIQLTSTLRWFSLMLPTMLFAMTQESTGSASLFTSTGSFVDSLLPARSTGVCVERDTLTTRHGLPAGLPGRETTPSPFAATVDLADPALLSFLVVFWILSRGYFSCYFAVAILEIWYTEIMFNLNDLESNLIYQRFFQSYVVT